MGFFDKLIDNIASSAKENKNKNENFKQKYEHESDEFLIREAIRILRRNKFAGDGHAAIQILKSRGYNQEDINNLIINKL